MNLRTIKSIGTGICSVAIILGIVEKETAPLRTNKAGLELIANAEGCRQKPYSCSAGVLTVGIGSTHNVNPNQTYSNEDIAKRFIIDVHDAEECVNAYANGKALNQNQFNALTSFAFNLGCRKSSTLFRMARENRFPQACDELKKWIFVNGKKSNGLIARREKEYQMCISPPKPTHPQGVINPRNEQ